MARTAGYLLAQQPERLPAMPDGPAAAAAPAGVAARAVAGSVPGAVLADLAGRHALSGLVFAMVDAGLDAALAAGPRSLAVLVHATGIGPEALRLLLRALAGQGLVEPVDGRWRLARHLAGAVPAAHWAELAAHRAENRVWLDIAAILTARIPAPDSYRRELLDGRIAGRPGLRAMNRAFAGQLVDRLCGCAAPARVLDLGGGDGDMAAALLARDPGLRVDILDLASGFAPSAALARRVGARLGRITGDARTTRLPARYDLVIVNELLELFGAADKRAILGCGVAALAPGGRIAVVKFTLDRMRTDPPSGALFSLRMRLKTGDGYLESDDEVEDMLRALGCARIGRIDLDGIKTVIVADAPAPAASPAPRAASGPSPAPAAVTAVSGDPAALPWGELVSLATAFRLSCVMQAALDLDLFALIGPAGARADTVAAAAGMDPVAARVLLDGLVAIGLLARDGADYLVPAGLERLAGDSPGSIRGALRAFRTENRVWLELADMLRAPGERPRAARIMEAAGLPDYLAAVGQANQAEAAALVAALADALPPGVPGPRRALDLGGGTGLFAEALCARWPDLRVTLLDRDEVIARHRAAPPPGPLWTRIDPVVGDARDPAAAPGLVPGFDLVLLSDLLHYFARDEKAQILARAAALLAPGGRIAIGKFALDADGVTPGSAALLSLRLHVQRPGAYLETDAEAEALLTAAGLAGARTIRLGAHKSLVTGQRP
ncbi:methyltransferase [Sphingomonas changnyeongensis]|uniref:Methyltransferase n=1 Tax=Sphingomonas changnyeongensis TaxID=2698679 RepID=A0A7Z2S7Q8_9SPHN|nr:class I SAM-dependent methyltransferase [Sphingomonas changnyeongensis]QHL89877.1 methyltransferase [Sphingomonas changnyeongensis]